MSFEMLKKFLSYVVSKEQLFDILKNISEIDNMANAIDLLVKHNVTYLSDFLILFRKIAKDYLQTAYLEKNGNKLDIAEKICVVPCVVDIRSALRCVFPWQNPRFTFMVCKTGAQ